FRFVRPWREWLLHFGFHPDHGTPDLSPEGLKPRIQSLIGDPTVDVEVGDLASKPHLRGEDLGWPGFLRRRCDTPASAEQRTWFQCLGAGRVQHRLETRLCTERSCSAGAVGVLRSRAPANCEADRGSCHYELGPVGAAQQ